MEIKKRRRFSKEFKIDTVNMIMLGDKNVATLAEELGIANTTLYRWIRQYHEDPKDAFPGEGKLKPSDEELRKLRQQLKDVTEERDILKKAIAIFSKGPNKNTNS